jgi:anti-anti-sigma factor|tara:strand:+ start:10190 stop:10498 length:309 start_codon:yes stop_codon:yes gene_type:complete
MGVSTQVKQNDKAIVITVSGRFDFSVHRDFRECYKELNHPGFEYRVNLQQTEYLDSSALGMLLLLKQHAEKNKGSIVIEEPSEPIRKILQIAHFERFMAIEG